MSLKLYYIPQSRATRPRWLLEELGVPYELVRLSGPVAERRTPEYLKIHPHGRVPAILDGDVPVFESAAICLYLADKFMDKGFAPALDAPERGPYVQWLVYSMVTLEPPLYQYYLHTQGRPEAERNAAVAQESKTALTEVLGVLEAQLGQHPYMVGKEFTAADVMIGSTLAWARGLGLLEGHPASQDYVQRLLARPAAQKARAD